MGRRALLPFVAAVCVLGWRPESAAGQVAQRFTIGGRDIVNMTFGSTQVGELPTGLKLLSGNVDVVDVGGVHMLRASSVAELELPLPQSLPTDFTVEFEFIPKQCCNPQDLAIEGTSVGHSNPGSSQVTWHRNRVTVIGGGESFATEMPEVLANSTPGTPTVVQVVMQGTTLKLYTNGRRIYTLSDRKFVRAQKLWIWLGGQDDGKYAVYVSRIRVIDNVAPVGPIVASSPPPPSVAGGAAPPAPASAPAPTTAAPATTTGTGTPTTASPTASAPLSPAPPTSTAPTSTAPLSPAPPSPAPASPAPASPAPVTAVPVAPATTTGTATAMPTSSPSGIGGSSATATQPGPASASIRNYGTFLVLSASSVPNAVSYNIFRKETGSSSPAQIPKYLVQTNLAQATGDIGGIDPYLVPNTNLTYWVEAVFANGSTSVPSPIATTQVNQISLTAFGPLNLTVSISGTQSLAALNGPGSVVTWTWDGNNTQFGYGIGIDILSRTAPTQMVREYFAQPIPTAQNPAGPPARVTYSRAIPSGTSVYFCAMTYPTDDPRTFGGGIALPFPPSTPGPKGFPGASCYLSQIP